MTRARFSLGRCLAPLLAALLLSLGVSPASAVLVFLRGQDKPVTGVLLREDTAEIVLRERGAGGKWSERHIPRAEIVDIIQTVSRERLAGLSADKPGDYRDYAEELSEKRQDPEAQEAGLRLFLIAAWLDPVALGKSSLLGMIKLARSPEEERAFRAMAFLLDPAHDRGVLQEPSITSIADAGPGDAGGPAAAGGGSGRKLKDDERQSLLKALQTVRSGSTASRRGLAKRANIKALLAPYASQLSWDEFTSAASGVCSVCENGFVKCEACDGTGKVTVGGSRINCSECAGKRVTTCAECGGDFATAPMAPALLAKILSLELALRGGNSTRAKPAAIGEGGGGDAEAGSVEKWTAAVGGRHTTAPMLSLVTLTEFDPRQCLYRDGKWVAPEKP